MRTLLLTLILSVAVVAAEVQKTNEQFVVAKGLAVQPFATQGQKKRPIKRPLGDCFRKGFTYFS